MKAEITIPDVTNGFLRVYLNGHELTAYKVSPNGDLSDLIEVVKTLNPDSVLHKEHEPRLLRLRFESAIAECTIQDNKREIAELEAKQRIESGDIPAKLAGDVGITE